METPKITAEMLRKVPYKLLASELARRNSKKAKKASKASGIPIGRPKVLKPCPVCGAMLSAVERRKHSPAWCAVHEPNCKTKEREDLNAQIIPRL